MEWYYAENKDAIGPLSEQEFQSLVSTGKITLSTLVWHQGMKNWQQYSQATDQRLNATVEVASTDGLETSVCSQCGVAHPEEKMIRYGDVWVCAGCKPLFVQKLKEGVSVTGALDYAGFWIRFGAKFVDSLILMVISLLFSFGAKFVTTSYADPYQTMTLQIFLSLVQVIIGATYTTWFLGKFGATPGKMAFNLRVVLPDGGDIRYLRALGRHFAEWLSGILLGIGYLMVAFDSEKRSLHDRICNTRVVKI